MQQSEWDRRRAYLTRSTSTSLFVDLPPLSPVPEEDSPSQVSTEPFSLLPELTIERIKPVNKHDEPEEFYVDLERKMQKLYRHLFFEERSEEAEELLRRYGPGFQETPSSRDDMDHSIRETSKVTKRGEFTNIEISGLAEKDDSNANGGKRGSTPGVIDLNISESISNDSPEILRHYNTRRHSMGSIRLSGAHGRGSSLLHDNITRSRTLDPELEACDTTEVSDVKISNVRKYSAEYSDKHGKVWTYTDTEVDSNKFEEEARGIVTSTPKTKQREKSHSNSKSPIPKSLPKSKSPSQSQSGTLTSDDEDQDILNMAVISKDLTFTNIDNELNPARRSSFSKRGTTSLEGSGEKRTSSIGWKGSGGKRSNKRRVEGSGEERTTAVAKGRKKKRKRVPEETIYWDDIKNNLFVGEPKVYKLCSCQDHVCNNE